MIGPAQKSTRFCEACGRQLVERTTSAGRFDYQTGEPVYQTRLLCPYEALPWWAKFLSPRDIWRIHDDMYISLYTGLPNPGKRTRQ